MNQTLSRIITGSLILLIGLGAFLDALNVFNFWQYFGTFWPLLLIVGGILVLINNTHQFIWAIILIGAGILLQLRNFNLVDVNVFSLFWPAIIVAVGLSILLNKSMTSKNARVQDLDDIAAIFGGTETTNTSKDYKGGKATAVFGGVSIDLRDAVIKKEATLNVFALAGGIELKVPREWHIKQQVFPILGGVESKSQGEHLKSDAPVLIVTGTVALGGVEIKR